MLKARLAAGVTAAFLLVACGHATTPEQRGVDANAAALESGLRNLADRYEAEANNAADVNAADAMRNAADGLDEARDNVANAADTRKEQLR